MLSYHPAFDAYHSAFRSLQVLMHDPERNFELSRLELTTFLLLFPSLISEMRLPKDFVRYRKQFIRYHNPYYSDGDARAIFRKAHSVFNHGIAYLVSTGIVQLTKPDWLTLRMGSATIASELLERVTRPRSDVVDVLAALKLLNEALPLTGRDGLKDRSNLVEYRYDPPSTTISR